MKYSQGWLVGQDGTFGHLVPFEICVRYGGSFRITWSGPVGQDLQQSYTLCSWAVQQLLHDIGITFKPFDYHINFPLHRINGSGVSCRLSLAYSLLDALGVKLPFPPSKIVLTGDLNLNGDVLPVDGGLQKINAVRAAGFQHFIVADQQPEVSSFLIRIHHLKELIGRNNSAASIG